MASRIMKSAAKCFGIDLKRVVVRIYPQNTGVPVVETEGGVAGVVRSAAGKFLITLDDSYFKFRSGQATYRDERDNVDLTAQLGIVLSEGTTTPITVEVRLKTATVNTDVAAGAGARDRCIYVELEFEDVAV